MSAAFTGRVHRRVIGTTGDVNTLQYGGGIVFRNRYGVSWWRWDEPLEGSSTVSVNRISVPDDVLAYHDWVKPETVATGYGTTVEDLRLASVDPDPMQRVSVLEMIGDYYGYINMDEYPVNFTPAKLRRMFRRHL